MHDSTFCKLWIKFAVSSYCELIHKFYAIQKHPGYKNVEAKLGVPVNVCLRLKGLISGKAQGNLRFNHILST